MPRIVFAVVPGALALTVTALLPLVPTDLQQPGTQPGQSPTLGANCTNCHAGYDPRVEPGHNHEGGPMAQAGRDPLFWATVAIAEQDYPGAGDLCLRCHAPRGWIEGRSSPSDGSALTASDAGGVECALCHSLVHPDGREHPGVQFAPFVAVAPTTPPEPMHGTGMYVLHSGSELLGPYATTAARHGFLQSRFHRDPALCGTCHDVSNPLVGDVAPGNGAMLPLPPGTFRGAFGGPVTEKVAFQLPPYMYGAVERTFSEHQLSGFANLRVRDFATLPRELQGGAIERAWRAATAGTPAGDYADGTPRTFSCQSCHLPPITGRGADKANVPVRGDLPLHDMTGGNTWLASALLHMDAAGTLPFGGPLTTAQRAALADGVVRARATLQHAALLSAVGGELRVVNRTGHKLPTGFPEGRRAWLHVVWRDAAGAVLREDGAYGPRTVTHRGATRTIETLLDPDGPHSRIYEAKPGVSQAWAAKLIANGVPGALTMAWDPVRGTPTTTLADIAAMAPGTVVPTFHFVLNDQVAKDSRVPPYRFDRDGAARRAALPIPPDQYGDPGPGEAYDHRDVQRMTPPTGAVRADVELLYQTTSWEYVQFLEVANDGSVTTLATAGAALADAWFATGMSAPEVMARTTWCRERGTGDDFELSTEVGDRGDPHGCRKTAATGEELSIRLDSPDRGLAGALAAIVVQLVPDGAPSPGGLLPGVWFDRTDLQITVPGLPPDGAGVRFTLPAGAAGWTLRIQGAAIAAAAANRTYATTDAHDIAVR